VIWPNNNTNVCKALPWKAQWNQASTLPLYKNGTVFYSKERKIDEIALT